MSVQRERQVFDPECINAALKADLPNGLRALADAIESGEIDGRLVMVQGNGMRTSWRDDRAHILITLDIAAEIFRWVAGERIALNEPPTIALPVNSSKALTKGNE